MAFFLVLWLVNQSTAVREGVGRYFRDPLGHTTSGGSSMIADGGGEGTAVVEPVTEPEPRLDREAEEIQNALNELPSLEGLAGQIEVELTPEGLRIQLMESENGTFFDLGSPRPSARGMEALATIGQVIGPRGYQVIVEGHTDSRPFTRSRDYGNWELSADRANSARRILETSLADPKQLIAIRGLAATQPRFAEHPEDPRNRRISILVRSSPATS
jgi:chemotaxis protein MotB